MVRATSIRGVLVAGLLLASSAGTAAQPAQDCTTVIARYRNASVSVVVEGTLKATGEILKKRGSGVIISPDGYFLTNHHVVTFGPDYENVTIAGSIGSSQASAMPVRLIDSEQTHDLALLKFTNTAVKYEAAPASLDTAAPAGLPLCSFGYPLDIEFHTASGILGVQSGPGGWSLLDVVTNPGESGSPVFDRDGHLIGLRVAGRDDAVGIYYMVPMNLAARLLSMVPNRLKTDDSGELPAVIAKRYWEAVYKVDNNAAYKLFPSVHKTMSMAEFGVTLAKEMSQFKAPPLGRDEETSMEVNGFLTITTIARFDDISRFREILHFSRQDGRWTPWRTEIAPIDWPMSNTYQFLPLTPAAILKAASEVPQEQRAKFIADGYEGKYVVPPGWQLLVTEVSTQYANRTCNVLAREEGVGTPVLLERLFDGCALTKDARLRVIGRIKTVDSSVRLESVRFWK